MNEELCQHCLQEPVEFDCHMHFAGPWGRKVTKTGIKNDIDKSKSCKYCWYIHHEEHWGEMWA